MHTASAVLGCKLIATQALPLRKGSIICSQREQRQNCFLLLTIAYAQR